MKQYDETSRNADSKVNKQICYEQQEITENTSQALDTHLETLQQQLVVIVEGTPVGVPQGQDLSNMQPIKPNWSICPSNSPVQDSSRPPVSL